MKHSTLTEHYRQVRAQSLALVAPLSAEDCCVQSMPDASPAKWHLGHTTWFFETFILEALEVGFKPFDVAFRVLFNSYYKRIGEQHPRAQRGALTRPGLDHVLSTLSIQPMVLNLPERISKSERPLPAGRIVLAVWSRLATPATGFSLTMRRHATDCFCALISLQRRW